MENPWVSYVTRSYSAIKASINARLSTVVPELTDKSPSNLMQVLIDIWAGIGELLNYYIDTTARELYVTTARRLTSMLKLAELASYNGQAAVPSIATLTLTIDVAVSSDKTVPQGTIFQDTNGNKWTSEAEATIRPETDGTTISVAQYEAISDEVLGTTNGLASQLIALPTEYAEGSLDIVINSVSWSLVNAFGYYGPQDKVFITKIYPDGLVYLVFGNGVNGAIPTASQTIYGSYHSTNGLDGNAEVGTITTIVSDPAITGVNNSDLTVTNYAAAVGGVGIQGREELRKSIPISQRTLSRAVTQKDYEDLAVLYPGVRAAKVAYDCGPRIKIHVVGEGGGNPTQALLDAVQADILSKSVVTLGVQTIASGESHVRIVADITGKFRKQASVIAEEVTEALLALYSPSSSKINQPVRVSDIIATIDNSPSVDFLALTYLYIQPYLKPTNLLVSLVYDIVIYQGAQGASDPSEISWLLTCTDNSSSGNEVFSVRRNGFAVTGTVTVGDPATPIPSNPEDVMTIRVTDATGVQVGDRWEFVTYKTDVDVELTDNSIPVILPQDLTLNITETYNK